MQGRTFIPLVVVFFLACSMANGALTNITFDEFGLDAGCRLEVDPLCAQEGVLLSTQFASLGVAFGLAGDPAIAYLGVNPFVPGGPGTGKYLTFNTMTPFSTTGILNMLFAAEVTGSTLQMTVVDTERSVTLNSYDSSDNLLETLVFSGGGSDIFTAIFSLGRVRRVEVVDTGGDGYVIDDLTYQLIPEPATFVLLGAGLAGIGFWKRRRSLRRG